VSFPGIPRGGSGDDGLVGVFVATVRDNEDPEGMGRVRLEYPWRETSNESYWARIAVPMAGNGRGTYFLPEVGDEVLVAFENGDIDHPFVLGSLWNGQDEPPADNADGNNDVRRITSRSGHELTFDDGESDGHVTIETAAGHSIELDDSGGSERITIEDTGGNEIEFDGTSGSLSISGTSEVSVEAPMIEISSSGSLSIEAGGVLTLDGALIKLN
jgi:uncharacterized protein involved in type VI secretion and phage assembly